MSQLTQMTEQRLGAPRHRDLSTLVNPASIAIIGASDRPGSLGARSVENLLVHSRFDGEPFLISKSKDEIAGHRTFGSILEVPGPVDVAMLVVPAAATLDVLSECAAADVKYAIVFTSGFGEMGAEGKAAEIEMARVAHDGGLRIYGPNSPGLCNVNKRLGMMFSPSFAVDQFPGPIGLATQGGGIGRCFLQGLERGVGVGLWASTGNEVDLTVADFIRYMADADDITTIATAMEGIKDGADFIDAVMYAAERDKPVVALKVGRSEYGARAVASHTGSLSGSVEVNRTALRQAGVVEVDDLDELIDTASLFARQRPRGGSAVAVYGFSGGACAMTADAVGAAELTFASFTEQTSEQLRSVLPDYAGIANPVDATSDILSRPKIGFDSLLATAEDSNVDLVLYPFPCDYDELTGGIAQSIVDVQRKTDTLIVPVWMSDRRGPGFDALVAGGMVPIGSVNRGVRAVGRWISWPRTRPEHGWRSLPPAPSGASMTLTEVEGKRLMRTRGINVPWGGVATSADGAVRLARDLGGPVVLKIVSADIIHKSDVGGVVVCTGGESSVREGFASIMNAVGTAAPNAKVEGILVEELAADGIDLLVGVTRDPTFGPVVTFGLGGIFVELFADVSRRLLPLTESTARQLVTEPKCSALLKGMRGKPAADIDAVVDLLLKVSDLVAESPDIQELELNPVRVHGSGEGVTVLDAVLVREQSIGDSRS